MLNLVKVDNYSKKGSGPGTSQLLKCENISRKNFFLFNMIHYGKKKVTNSKNITG